jgi:hypothetical protein
MNLRELCSNGTKSEETRTMNGPRGGGYERIRQMRLAGSLALVVTGVLLMPDPLLAQWQELVCGSHSKERPRIRKALPGGSRARKVAYSARGRLATRRQRSAA